MDYFTDDREWHVNDVQQNCLKSFLLDHCLIEYNIKIERYSSMYVSSILIPALGMRNDSIYNGFIRY